MQRTQPESARKGARQDGIDEIDPNLAGAGIRVGIVMARFNLNIGEGLLSACTDELLQLGVARSDDVVFIQITANNTRGMEQKKALFSRTAQLLGESPGLRPEDVFINIVEVAKENWSFGHGLAQYA